MLRCLGNRIYTGYATDVEARFEQHKAGKGAKFTHAFPPECILKTFEVETHEKALRLEARVKKLPRTQKEKLVAGDETLTEKLMAGLAETLVEKKTRVRRERRAKSATKRRAKSSRKT
ncbi:GIY-YIG nuclease family protein [uncultured Fibrobacter sp.]|uniref:GIY-YIG nuclease family protein n=1 Tax=uncultured Fibrobacter sp. TaxID=261512 RepID=UPI0025F0F13F|nr:GIY-YIG nuclease family protein [uncultured Fibrobacter sp.]